MIESAIMLAAMQSSIEQCVLCRPTVVVSSGQESAAYLRLVNIPDNAKVFINDVEVEPKHFYVPPDYYGLYYIRIVAKDNTHETAYNVSLNITEAKTYVVDVKTMKFFRAPSQIESDHIHELFTPGKYVRHAGSGQVVHIQVSETGEFDYVFDFGLEHESITEPSVYMVVAGQPVKMPLVELRQLLSNTQSEALIIITKQPLHIVKTQHAGLQIPTGLNIIYATRDWQARQLNVPFEPSTYLRTRNQLIKLLDSDNLPQAIEAYNNYKAGQQHVNPIVLVAAGLLAITSAYKYKQHAKRTSG